MPDNLSALQRDTRTAVLEGPGTVDPRVRQQVAAGQPPVALATLVRKVRDCAYLVTDEGVDALRSAYSEEQLFEVIVAAAVGAAEHRLRAALAVLEDAK